MGPLEDVSLHAAHGEILGLAGLVGSGRSDLMLSLFGVHQPRAGTLSLDGAPLRHSSPADAVRQGIAYLTADRHGEGMFPDRSLRDNLSVVDFRRYTKLFHISASRELRDAQKVIRDYSVVVASAGAPMSSMSGGNQQKVAVARWLELRPRLLLLNEPTQGVDVGARAAIHQLVRDAATAGTTVLVASSDSSELSELCDRVLGLYDGRVSGEASGERLTASRCLELSYGGALATSSGIGASFGSGSGQRRLRSLTEGGHPAHSEHMRLRGTHPRDVWQAVTYTTPAARDGKLACQTRSEREGAMTHHHEQTKKQREPRTIKLDATPEQVAKAMFAAAKPPDPSLRKTENPP